MLALRLLVPLPRLVLFGLGLGLVLSNLQPVIPVVDCIASGAGAIGGLAA